MSAVAAPKKDLNDLALGFLSGTVRCVDIKSSKANKIFVPEVPNNAVRWLDYNCDDKYLASVLENGVTEILNVPLNVVSDSVKADRATTIARFHHNKSTWLGLASRQGIVSVYDLVFKKFVFKLNNAHTSIVKDLAFDSTATDLLCSASYDTTVKVYDMRKKYDIASIKCEYPVNTILAASQQVVVGTLGGTLELFDLRNYKKVRFSRYFFKVIFKF